MATLASTPNSVPFMVSRIIAVVIVILAGINGIFTFSGASLFIGETYYALLFAIAVQFSIAVSLIAVPYVSGFGKFVLFTIYLVALTLSTLSAYTYIYNAGLPEGQRNVRSVSTQLKTRISDDLSEIHQIEQRDIDARQQELSVFRRQMEEEAAYGYKSGLGPGKGREYVRKQEVYEADLAAFEPRVRNFEQLQSIYRDVEKNLLQGESAEQREQLILLLSRMRGVVNADESKQILSELTANHVSQLKNPVERAISIILDRGSYSIQLFVSIIWAAVFDLLALFMGVVRYYILRPDYSIMNGIYEGVRNLFMFFIRISHAKKDAHLHYKRETESTSHDVPLNSPEMQSFATYILAGSFFSAGEGEDALQPLQRLIGMIEPLRLEDNPRSIGLPFSTMDEAPELKTLMALLIKNEVFLASNKYKSYVLNPASEMAQKILVFFKMGLKDGTGNMRLDNQQLVTVNNSQSF